jgi:hypothetical protein
MAKLQSILTYKRYQQTIKFSEISKLVVYPHVAYLYCHALQFSGIVYPIEESFHVTEYTKTNSCTSVQSAFRKRVCKDPPPRAMIQRWFNNLENLKKSGGYPCVSGEAVSKVEATFH